MKALATQSVDYIGKAAGLISAQAWKRQLNHKFSQALLPDLCWRYPTQWLLQAWLKPSIGFEFGTGNCKRAHLLSRSRRISSRGGPMAVPGKTETAALSKTSANLARMVPLKGRYQPSLFSCRPSAQGEVRSDCSPHRRHSKFRSRAAIGAIDNSQEHIVSRSHTYQLTCPRLLKAANSFH